MSTPRIVVEDLLGAVAVVSVDVDNGHAAVDAVEQSPGGDRRVVEVARAAEAAAGGVVARRSGQGVGDRLTRGHQVRGGQRRVGSGPRGLPGALSDQGHRVVDELAGARGRACGLHRLELPEHSGVREQVGHDLGLTGVVG